MINNVTLVGRITKDLELRKTNNNDSYCGFTLAVDKNYKKNNEQSADFINCIAWRQSAEYLCKYARKGDMVGVQGRIATRTYDGQNGKVYVTEVMCDNVMICSNKEKTETESKPKDEFANNQVVIESDDLPFY